MAARVVRFLLVHRDFVPEDQLLETFWRDRDPVAARRCLTVSVSRCRAVLVPTQSSAATGRTGSCSIRTTASTSMPSSMPPPWRSPTGPGHERLSLSNGAARLWTGEPLPEDQYADWAREWRDALADRHREVLVALADVQADAGEHGAALRTARRMLEADPLDEGAHRRVMAGYAVLGRRSRALEQYLRCRRLLVDALGVEPARETAALHARILAGEEGVLAA